MRIVDEIDAATAQLFERFCASKLGNFVPLCLHGELSFPEVAALVAAGLLVDPGALGQVSYFSEVATDSEKVWFVGFREDGLSLPLDLQVPSNRATKTVPLRVDQKRPVIPVYVLTDAGHAVSDILPDLHQAAFERYVKLLQSYAPGLSITIYKASGNDKWMPALAPDTSS
jgi:hypothetical protein